MAEPTEHVFAGNPLLFAKREVRQPKEAAALMSSVREASFLPVSDGKPLIAAANLAGRVTWELAWQSADVAFELLDGLQPSLDTSENVKDLATVGDLVYLGELQERSFYAFNVPKSDKRDTASRDSRSNAKKLTVSKEGYHTAYIDVRMLMVATTFDDSARKADLAIVGYVSTLALSTQTASAWFRCCVHAEWDHQVLHAGTSSFDSPGSKEYLRE